MRTCDRLLGMLLIGTALGLAPALGFDGNTNPRAQLQSLPSPAAPIRPGERPGERSNIITSLEYAAEKGEPKAQWRLGHMYAKGDGVPRSDLRAFGYFGKIANLHGDDGLDSPNARIVASAIVAVGQYYLDGIPDSDVKSDPARARRMFFYAATYFGDPDAQYLLGRLFLDGNGGTRDPVQAARWLKLAANKDQHPAQALLGDMLVKGDLVPRQVPRGLMYLVLAHDASPDEPSINALYQQALAQASVDDRSAARIYLQQWVRGLRD
jgi:TPR repeat protein